MQGELVVEFLLLDRSFPRSVLFCAERCLAAVRAISGDSQQLERSLGMLVAKVSFVDVSRLDALALDALLDDVLTGVHAVGQRARRAPTSRRASSCPAPTPSRSSSEDDGMLIKVEHTTSFTYAARIGEAFTELRVRPLSGGGQDCTSFRLVTDPPGVSIRAYRDRLGNHVQHLEVLEDHDRISITALSEVSTAPVFSDSGRKPSPLELYDYLAPTEYAPFSDALVELSATAEGEGTETERAVAVMRAVRSLLVYEPGATDVMTRADAALALGRGVCQDFAHVMLAACRRAGIPSRYVSGYLYDPLGERGPPRTPGWTSSTPNAAGSRSTRRTTASRPRPTSASPWAATTPMCPRREACGRGTAEETLEVAVRISPL